MENKKGFQNYSENQELKSILVDIGLIFYSEYRDYREYLKSLFYKPMSIQMNNFIRQLYNMSDEQLEYILQQL